jgi:trans-2,3-dihydro-3-hydroxyanthranilic acid synthase
MSAGLRPVEPYSLPDAAELPDDRTGWQPDPRRAALLIHDMQRYFLRAFPEQASPAPQLIANAARLRAACAQVGVPVFYTAQPGSMTTQERGLLQTFWGPGMRATAEDRRILDELAPEPGDVVLTKWRYSAFQRTELLPLLREAGRDQLLICGVYAHVGCLMTAVEAFTHDIEAFLIGDAVADMSEREHRMALDYAAATCARVPATEAAVAALTGVRA